MEVEYCQSCGMPMEKEELFGVNKDGSLNHEYCIHCYQGGNFTFNMDMESMIETTLDHMPDYTDQNGDKITRDEQKQLLEYYFQTLKRWQK